MAALSATLKRVMSARVRLILGQPFFGMLALQLRTLDDPTADTAWTDGTSLGFSPAFVATLDDDALTGLVAHEVMHCAAGHPWRRGTRDPKTWNVACDYAINHILTDAGFTLPAGGLLDSQYAGRSAEWIYDRLPQPRPDQQGDQQPGQGNGPGEVRDAPQQAPSGQQGDQPGQQPGDTPGQGTANTEADWQRLTKQAVMAAKGRGSLPAGLADDITAATAPIVDWRSLLRRYMQEITTADYSWSQPSRRYLASGLYLPSLRSIACGKIAVAIDTSASIDTVALGQFGSELLAIIDELQPSSIDVLYCDTRINRVDTYLPGDQVTLTAEGRGGTSFVPVFEHYDDPAHDQPAVLVYFTDLDGPFPDQVPDYPVIWAATDTYRRALPFGDLVPLCQ